MGFGYPSTLSQMTRECRQHQQGYDHQDSIGGGEMYSNRNKMLIAFQICAISLCAASIMSSVGAQTPNRTADRGRRLGVRARSAFTWPVGPAASALIPAAGPSLQVIGGGTLGRLPKWTGFTFTNSVIGDSTIFEDKFGNVGIGTDAPASRFTVAGMIETTLGGYKFPDGTVQTTSATGALFGVSHDG